MLRVARLRDRSGRYYLADPAEELATLCGERGARGWTGEGAAELGLAGIPSAGALEAVLSGCHPSTGRSLVSRKGTIAGYDLTFAAPKSVSVLYALGGDDTARAVVAAHLEAVEAAMGYVGRRAAAARRGGAEPRIVGLDGVVAASFAHGVSRAADPHLHSHVVVANVGHGRDGRWSAIDSRGLYAHSRAAGALYDAHLRRVLVDRLDAGWESQWGRPYEVAGMPPMVLGALSRRQAEIRTTAHELGSTAAFAGLVTRADKAPPVALDRLRRQWRALAHAVGMEGPVVVGRDRAGPARRPGGLRPGLGRADVGVGADIDEHRFAAALSELPSAAAARRDVTAAWAGAVTGGATVASVEGSVSLLVAWGSEPGVAEQRHTLRSVSPETWQLRALGPRPADPARLSVWRGAAATLDAYRAQWPPPDSKLPLGIEGTPAELARLPTRHLAAHLSAARGIDEARRLLGRARSAPGLERDMW